LILFAALLCTACGKSQQDNSAQPPPIGENTLLEAPPINPATIKPGEPGGLPDDRTPVSEGAIDPKSAQGASQVLQLFGGLLEQGKFGRPIGYGRTMGAPAGLATRSLLLPMTNMPRSTRKSVHPGEWKALPAHPMSTFPSASLES